MVDELAYDEERREDTTTPVGDILGEINFTESVATGHRHIELRFKVERDSHVWSFIVDQARSPGFNVT